MIHLMYFSCYSLWAALKLPLLRINCLTRKSTLAFGYNIVIGEATSIKQLKCIKNIYDFNSPIKNL